MEWLVYLKTAWEVVPWLWKIVSLRRLRNWWRNRRIAPHIRRHHLEFVHPMRELGFKMSENWKHDEDPVADLLTAIVTACGQRMCELIGLAEGDLHCCLKVMAPRLVGDNEDRVSTWVRSKPRDARPIDLGPDNARLVSKNTAWCCLLSKDDKSTKWRGFKTFACNNLTAAKNLFACDREDWQKYYQSALVFTIRYPKNLREDEFLVVGFLVFDSPRTDAFSGVPNIFKFRDHPDLYASKMERSAAFHLGGVFADLLGSIIGPAYLSNAPNYEMKPPQNGGE
jgi:hypothetical protein